MTPERFLDCLKTDYDRFRDVAGKDLHAAVPSCPGWTVTDLVRHVAEVYFDKVESMRTGKEPDQWPPPGLAEAEPMPLLSRAWNELMLEFADRDPGSPSFTWYEPDQSVGFWFRRMAQETVIHRIDAELALADEVQPVPDDLAVDGVDEVLRIFLEYASKGWSAEFGADLATADGRPVLVSTGGSAWLLRAHPAGVDVETGATDGGPAARPATGDIRPGAGASGTGVAGASGTGVAGASGAAATVDGAPEAMLRWLWGRGGDGVTIGGDAELVAQMRRLLVTATQ